MAVGRDANSFKVLCICSANDIASTGHEGTNGKRYDAKTDIVSRTPLCGNKTLCENQQTFS